MILKSSYAIRLFSDILCLVDRASPYILTNKINSMHNLFLVYSYLSVSTCFGWLCAHRQEIKLCLCDTWYLLYCVARNM